MAPPARGDSGLPRTYYTIVWSDPDGIDLMSPEGTYVRASVESLDVSAVNGEADAAAPGFWETLIGPAKTEAQDFLQMGPARTEYGIKRYEVLDTAVDGVSTAVTVCAYNQQIAHDTDTDEYEFGGTGPFSMVITFEKVGGREPPSRQTGPETFALAPVFGSWRTTRWKLGYFAEGDPCAGRRLPGVEQGSWPQTRGSGPYITDQLPRQPNYPGWPKTVS